MKTKQRKKIRLYTVKQRTEDNKSTETKEFSRLFVARKHANKMNREGRFISLTNIGGIPLCL